MALTTKQRRALVWLAENQPAAWEDFQDEFGLNPEEPGELREMGLADYVDGWFSVSPDGYDFLGRDENPRTNNPGPTSTSLLVGRLKF